MAVRLKYDTPPSAEIAKDGVSVFSDAQLLAEVDGLDAEEFGGLAQLFFDAEELVVFCDAVGAGGRAGFDLACACAYGEVGDEGVFGFAASVADDAGVAEATGQLDGFEGLGDRADLVDLDED